MQFQSEYFQRYRLCVIRIASESILIATTTDVYIVDR